MKLLPGLNAERILVAPVDAPAPPSDISPQAKEIWSDVVAELAPTRILTAVDIPALVMLCEGLAEYRETQAIINRDGRYQSLKSADGFTRHIRHPAVEDLQALDARIREWVREFCMSPASRAKANLSAPGDSGQRPIDLSSLTIEERASVRAMIEARDVTRQ